MSPIFLPLQGAVLEFVRQAARPPCIAPDGAPCAPEPPGCVNLDNSLPCSSSLADVDAAISRQLQQIPPGAAIQRPSLVSKETDWNARALPCPGMSLARVSQFFEHDQRLLIQVERGLRRKYREDNRLRALTAPSDGSIGTLD